MEGTEVVGVVTEGSRVTGVRTTQGEIRAPRVVNAAGLWVVRIGAMAGVEIPITVCRHKINIVTWPAEDAPDGLRLRCARGGVEGLRTGGSVNRPQPFILSTLQGPCPQRVCSPGGLLGEGEALEGDVEQTSLTTKSRSGHHHRPIERHVWEHVRLPSPVGESNPCLSRAAGPLGTTPTSSSGEEKSP
jgi:glycine/D-amino acid oxidase-like deaminating enzyme